VFQQTLATRLDLLRSSVESTASQAATAVSSAVGRLELATKSDLRAMQDTIAAQLQRTEREFASLARSVEGKGASSEGSEKSTAAALRGVQDSLTALSKDRDAILLASAGSLRAAEAAAGRGHGQADTVCRRP